VPSGVIGVQAQRLSIFRNCTIPIILVSKRAAEPEVCIGTLEVQAQGCAVFRNRVLQFTPISSRKAEV
jgi:hypothetical protein